MNVGLKLRRLWYLSDDDLDRWFKFCSCLQNISPQSGLEWNLILIRFLFELTRVFFSLRLRVFFDWDQCQGRSVKLTGREAGPFLQTWLPCKGLGLNIFLHVWWGHGNWGLSERYWRVVIITFRSTVDYFSCVHQHPIVIDSVFKNFCSITHAQKKLYQPICYRAKILENTSITMWCWIDVHRKNNQQWTDRCGSPPANALRKVTNSHALTRHAGGSTSISYEATCFEGKNQTPTLSSALEGLDKWSQAITSLTPKEKTRVYAQINAKSRFQNLAQKHFEDLRSVNASQKKKKHNSNQQLP